MTDQKNLPKHLQGLSNEEINQERRAHSKEPGQMIARLMELVQPDLRHYLRFPLRGKVTKVYEDEYCVDVKVTSFGKIFFGAFFPKIWVNTLFGGDGYGVWALPEVGAEVFLVFENGKRSLPYIDGCSYKSSSSPSGYKTGTFAIRDKTGNEVALKPDGSITIKAKGTVNVEGPQVSVKGDSRVVVDAPVVELGEGATSSGVLFEELAAILHGHGHPLNVSAGRAEISTDFTTLELARSKKTKLT